MASLETIPAVDGVQIVETVATRRLRAEWCLLEQLAALNPSRLIEPRWLDSAFEVTLLQTPALQPASPELLAEHRVRVVYPRFFPAVPLELYLAEPVVHPNVHPLTGFVCLWDRHRVSNTVEHALHKTVAMLGWGLLNAEAHHVMQPEALLLDREGLTERLATAPLVGVEHMADVVLETNAPRRRRLS